ncbi:rod shape-determining protein MreD [Calidifontibacter sp. DB0510]|uniref:Rod shape-determining protein MreD n=1 Tax=Metallococcus carri TaxID=1656884 RepID=A0A967EA49_9MICO|nr:rod shape-determining protein MreD [Metallococcus carri]NHN55905.1 rod shape-determining protein MreD [Metallococcus carri]NOP38407.1 rod shape-determining protein MreD [Calidifontibacter sp. DB2511S]
MIPHRLTVVRAVLLVLGVLLTVSVLPRWAPPPDLPLVLVVAVGLRAGSASGALMGCAAGWLLDLVPPGGAPLGLTALMYAGLGACAGLVQRSVRASVLLPAGCVLVSSVAAQAIRALAAVLGDTAYDLGAAAITVALTTALGAVLIPPILRIERSLVHRGLA